MGQAQAGGTNGTKEAFVKARRLGIHKARVEYKESKRGIRRAKRGHEKQLSNRINENSKAFYTFIKSKRVDKERVVPFKDKEGNLFVEPEELGKYFVSVFTVEEDLVDDESGE
eukprot:g20576.t1